nr:hypothetical protein [Tanacetum cinerariifolium]
DVTELQTALGAGNDHRLLVGVACREVVECQVEDNGHDRRRADARMEDGRYPAGKVIIEGRRSDRDHAKAQRGGDDDQVHVVV